ncbi:ulp1 protease family, C-terminal catalytic domain-containing protein [Artemisia annua]|uniref:Ulp1 protease family, C-terminal catalytic domain-containing protein n=1 Tax=Artemisia annua TaxID=35608 RepID=A0A2U1NHW4_ARTAN|nr:ulp1 protease family, C-terminal catalytic domain-containing protein [Artemisia annua]
MGVNLTPGAISTIVIGKCIENDLRPVLEVTYIQSLPIRFKDGKWYGVMLSDSSFRQFGCIPSEIFISKQLQKGSIVQLTKFQLTKSKVITSNGKGEIVNKRYVLYLYFQGLFVTAYLVFGLCFLINLCNYILVCDLNLLRTTCDIIGDPKPLPNNETPLVVATTPTIAHEDHVDSHLNENVDDSHHVEEPPTSKQKSSTSTQKCSSHSPTQNKKRKLQPSDDIISGFENNISKLVSMIVEKTIEDGLGACYKKLGTLEEVLRQEELELPVPDEDIPNFGSTVGAFIQWPIGAIARFSILLGLPKTATTRAAAKSTLPTNVQGPSTSTKSTVTKNVQGPSTECAALVIVPTITQASKKRKKTLKEPVKLSKAEKEKADIRKRLHSLKEDIDERSEAVKKGYYHWMAHEDCAMPQMVYFKKEIFRDADDFTLPINPIDIIELLTAEKLGTNILTLFLRSLYILKENSPNRNNKTGFLNPEMITADTHMDTDINVEIYLTEALKCETSGYDFFVAPYLQSGHHVLLIICPKHGRGFILDSYKWEKKRTKETYYLVKQVERAVGHLSWELLVVNLQEDTWECGFYVMKWVLDFVLKYQHDDFPNILPWGEERSLSISEIDAIVNAWFSLWRDF